MLVTTVKFSLDYCIYKYVVYGSTTFPSHRCSRIYIPCWNLLTQFWFTTLFNIYRLVHIKSTLYCYSGISIIDIWWKVSYSHLSTVWFILKHKTTLSSVCFLNNNTHHEPPLDQFLNHRVLQWPQLLKPGAFKLFNDFRT